MESFKDPPALEARFKSMGMGSMDDENTIAMIHHYVGPDTYGEEEAAHLMESMYFLKEGDDAPNPSFYSLDEKKVQLYDLLSLNRPTVKLEKVMQTSFSERVDFITIYIAEAHPSDGWKLQDNDDLGVCYLQPKSLKGRLKICSKFVEDYKVESAMFVDSIENEAMNAFRASPERLYIIDKKKIIYRGGLGPFQYSEDDMVKHLRSHLGEF